MSSAKKRVSIKAVESLPPNAMIWDTVVTGFGARRQRSSSVSYIVIYRTAEGRSRMQTIGRHGAPWTPDEAREEAKRILGDVAKGLDPSFVKHSKRVAPTVDDLCEKYLQEADAGRLLTKRGATKKASTVATDKSRIECHIRPLLGKMKVAAVTSRDIEQAMHDIAAGKTHKKLKLSKPRAFSNVRAGRGGASRTIGLLGAIFTFAVKNGWRDDNPVRNVTRFADKKRDLRLSIEDYRALGATLRQMESSNNASTSDASKGGIWPPALACIRFLILTGWRRGEALGLRWSDVDLNTQTARLTDTKTGVSLRPISRHVCQILEAQRVQGHNDLVFPPSRGSGIMSGFPKFLSRVTNAAGLSEKITAHTLRHSFASMAADGGDSELTVAALLGHRAGSVTARYVHTADVVLIAAADRVAELISTAMDEPCHTKHINTNNGAARPTASEE